MNQKNIDYLEKGLYYSGFGIEANKALNENIAKGVKDFTIPLDMQMGGKEASFRLEFKQSEKQRDMYFFNGYGASLKEDPGKSQYFAITKNHGITAREAVNLLEGRAVAKSLRAEDGSGQEIWTQINFSNRKENGNFERKTYFSSHGFDMPKALEGVPLKREDGKEIPKWIAASLKKGNAVPAEVLVDGKPQSVRLVANPEFRTIDVFNEKGTRILQSEGKNTAVTKATQSPPVKQAQKPEKKAAMARKAVPATPRHGQPAAAKGPKR